MNGLSCGEEILTIYSAILIQCQRVTEGQTDVQPISITCFSIADARKNRLCAKCAHRRFLHAQRKGKLANYDVQ